MTELDKLINVINIKSYRNEPVKLNLGCGDVLLDNYINIDLYDDNADIKLDIVTLPIISSNTVDYILSSHVIDHFDYKDGCKMIKECGRILKPGGIVRIECTDLLNACKLMIEYENESNWNMQYKLYTCIFGFPWAPGMTHKFGWTRSHLIRILTSNGFNNIVNVPLIEVDDYSKEKIDKYDLKYDDSYDWFDKNTFDFLNISIEAIKI